MNINAQTRSHECAIERNTDLSRPPGTEYVCEKYPERSCQPFIVQGRFDISAWQGYL